MARSNKGRGIKTSLKENIQLPVTTLGSPYLHVFVSRPDWFIAFFDWFINVF